MDLPSAVVLASLYGQSVYSSVTAKILQEEQELQMAAPLHDGTGWWRRGFAPVAYRWVRIDDIKLGARIGLVLGVLFVAERLKMTDFRDNFSSNETVASLSSAFFACRIGFFLLLVCPIGLVELCFKIYY